MKARATTNIDKVIGHNIRIRRRSRGYSQMELAELLGVTPQQVQKYEKGANRVASSRLWELAKLFEVPVQSFFVGLDSYPISKQPSPLALIAKNDALRMLEAFSKIIKPSLRRTMVALAEAVTASKDRI
jgi:transcriptional regulator with XRE-family HTH domain